MEDRYLFRGKSAGGYWYYGNVVYNFCFEPYGNITPCAICEDNDWIEVISETVGQCTGQKDKNKKLIYEHDQFIEQGRLYTIEWGEEGAWYAINDDCADTIYFNEWDYFKDIEIIGNIHDSKAVSNERAR